jgi:hypothetical protein
VLAANFTKGVQPSPNVMISGFLTYGKNSA